MAFHFLGLPSEIRIRIYELVLADPSLIVQYLFIRNDFRSMFRNKTPPALAAQVLRTCRQIAWEGAPVLYGPPQFDCSNCINGLEKLQAQIGPSNFKLIKRFVLDAEDLHGIADALNRDMSNGGGGGMYRNLESLATTAHRIVDLSQPGWEFELHAQELARLCQSARQILRSGSRLQVLGQNSGKDNSRSWGDAFDPSNYRVRWRFATSRTDLAPIDHALDVERLLDLALLIQRRSGQPILMVDRHSTPVPLVRGIHRIIYP